MAWHPSFPFVSMYRKIRFLCNGKLLTEVEEPAHMNLADHTATTWGAGAPRTKQESLGEKTHFSVLLTVSATKGSIMLKIDSTGVSASIRVLLWVFTVYMGSQAMSFPVFSLGLLSSSFCIKNGENSEKTNHMVSATSHIELEFLTKFVECQSCKIGWFCCTRGYRYTSMSNIWSFAWYHMNKM